MTTEPRPSRRIVFTGLGALGVAAVLAGCGGGDSGGPSSGGPGQETVTAGPKGEVLATTAEIPVGGGIILTDKQVVITQASEGEFAAFSTVCKHAGQQVGQVEDGTITCLVHGSTYDAGTGEQTGGPAPKGSALNKVEIVVEGDQILAA